MRRKTTTPSLPFFEEHKNASDRSSKKPINSVNNTLKNLNEAQATKQQKKTTALTYLIWVEQNCCCYAAFNNTQSQSWQGAWLTS